MLANGGLLTPLTILSQTGAQQSRLVLPKSVAKALTAMLETVVSIEGTANRAKIPSYRVAGKTSTVQKLVNGVYQDDLHRSMFAGFAPASDPKLVAVVMVDEPGGEHYFGGRVAAPAFRNFMSKALRILNVTPDDVETIATHQAHPLAGQAKS